MTAELSQVALIGLQSAGKTTYAVVFAAACLRGQDGMRITKYAGVGNREYLNKRAEELARCVPLERTSQQLRDEIRLRLVLSDTSPERELVMPDLSGEFLRDSMADRVLHTELHQLIDESDALLLFVRSDRILKPETIHDLNKLLRDVGEEPGNDVAPEAPDDWTIELAATEARLTDIVQEVMRLRGAQPLRLGLMLSAWDTQADETTTPAAWADGNLPLLVQMMNNEPAITWEAFGVSAQGGDFDGPGRAELEKLDVTERPLVSRGDGVQADIGAPLKWALESQ